MFVIGGVLKLVGILGAAILIGFVLLPADVLFIGLGALSLASGLGAMIYQLPNGGLLAASGAVMLIIGVLIKRSAARAFEAKAAATRTGASRSSRSMDAYIPRE